MIKPPGEMGLGDIRRLEQHEAVLRRRTERKSWAKAVFVFSNLLCFLALLTGCQLFHSEPRPSEAVGAASASGDDTGNADHGGYALLFDLLGDEKDVAKIRFIKHPRPGVTTLLKEISRVSSDAHKQLELFGKADKSLNLTDPRLPMGEV